MVKPVEKKQVAQKLMKTYSLSIRQACQLSSLHRSQYYYAPKERKSDENIIQALNQLAESHPTRGFWKMNDQLRNEGYPWNHKRIYRVYTELKLNIRRKQKRRLPARVKEPLTSPSSCNQVWSMDFMSDSLCQGRRFRTLNIIDDYNRELCWIEIGLSLTSHNVTEVLECLEEERNLPQSIRVDNGPEFTSQHFVEYCQNKQIQIKYIQPGKPTQNAYIERFNRSYRTEVLNAYLFHHLQDVRDITHNWAYDYNHIRPHDSLNKLPPITFPKLNI